VGQSAMFQVVLGMQINIYLDYQQCLWGHCNSKWLSYNILMCPQLYINNTVFYQTFMTKNTFLCNKIKWGALYMNNHLNESSNIVIVVKSWSIIFLQCLLHILCKCRYIWKALFQHHLFFSESQVKRSKCMPDISIIVTLTSVSSWPWLPTSVCNKYSIFIISKHSP
jgi:hypothetical protein